MITHFPVYDFVAQRALVSPDHVAIEAYDSGETLTYRQLNERANQAAYVLDAVEIDSKNTVAILSQNCVAFFELLFACAKQGAIFVPLNWRQTASETSVIVQDSQVRTIFYDAANETLAQELSKLCDGVTIIPLTGKADNSYAKRRDTASKQYREPVRALDDVWYLLYTSGTTGKPKAVVQNFAMAIANYVNTVQAIDLVSTDTTINFLPLFHTGGINLYTLPTLIAGGKVTVLSKFDPDAVVELIDAKKVSVFFGVPAIYRAIFEHDKFQTMDFSAVRSLGCGGAPIQEYILHAFADRGVTICNGFGMTETGPMVFLMDKAHAAEKIGSIGTPKLLTKVRIIDEQGNDQAPGQPGELLLAGANITPGYWGNPEATEKSIKDGWLYTGDVAKADTDGYYYIVDRIKDMYISGGENVYPAEVEAALEQHDNIIETVVVGIDDNKWGEIGCAFLRITPDYVLDQDALTAFARERLAGYKTPRYFFAVDDFPRTAAGKVKKNELRGQAIALTNHE